AHLLLHIGNVVPQAGSLLVVLLLRRLPETDFEDCKLPPSLQVLRRLVRESPLSQPSRLRPAGPPSRIIAEGLRLSGGHGLLPHPLQAALADRNLVQSA